MSLSGRASSRTVEPKSASSTTRKRSHSTGLCSRSTASVSLLLIVCSAIGSPVPSDYSPALPSRNPIPQRSAPQRILAGSKRSGGSRDTTPNSSTASPKEQVKSTSARS